MAERPCVVCGAAFAPRNPRYVTCGADECRRERRRLTAAAWYAAPANAAAHKANVVAARRRKRQAGARG